jgi:hypothetical protein
MSSSTIYPEDNEGQTMYTTEQQLEMVSAELAEAKKIIEILGALDNLQKIAMRKMLKGEQPIINTTGLDIEGAPEVIEFYLDGDDLDMRAVG